MPGSSASLLSSLRRIETPDDLTVRFLLSRPDTQFGWALASPAASIVDEEVYDADRVQRAEGPRRRLRARSRWPSFAADELQLSRYADYVGRTPARLAELVYRTVADSATIEDAMTKGTVDVVWRGLDAAAVTRLQPAGRSRARTSRPRAASPQTVLTGIRVLQLQWSPELPGPAEQGAADRRSPSPCRATGPPDSLVPGRSARPRRRPSRWAARRRPKVTWKNRINLTLGYDPTTPERPGHRRPRSGPGWRTPAG